MPFSSLYPQGSQDAARALSVELAQKNPTFLRADVVRGVRGDLLEVQVRGCTPSGWLPATWGGWPVVILLIGCRGRSRFGWSGEITAPTPIPPLSANVLHPLARGAVEPTGKTLTTEQRNMVDLIARAFEAAGWPPEIAAAAIVNAWAESRLSPRAWGDRTKDPQGCSGGLFQLNRCGGAGTGLTRAQVEDPQTNVKVVLQELRGAFGAPIRAAWGRGTRDVSAMTRLFTIHIMRPARREEEAEKRAAIVPRVFPLPLSHWYATAGRPMSTPSSLPSAS